MTAIGRGEKEMEVITEVKKGCDVVALCRWVLPALYEAEPPWPELVSTDGGLPCGSGSSSNDFHRNHYFFT
jgi:hypothetical protein